LSKNLQHVMAQAAATGRATACAGVGDQFALDAVFRHPVATQQQVKHAVEPSFVVPRRTEALPLSLVPAGGGEVWRVDDVDTADESLCAAEERSFKVSSSVIVSPSFSASSSKWPIIASLTIKKLM
jgi:EREBP-like factor